MHAVAEIAALFSREFAVSRAGLAAWMKRAFALLRGLGPYAAIEILLPGGTLIALTLWLYRWNRKRVSMA